MRFRFRILGITVVGLLTSLWAHGQPVDVEKDFDKRRSSYKLEKFSEEPETFDDSDYVRNIDYLYYLEGKKIVKIRVIESNGNGRNASIKITFSGTETFVWFDCISLLEQAVWQRSRTVLLYRC